jgi:hypothetical protein
MSVVEQFHLCGNNEALDWSLAPTLAAFNGASLKVEEADVHYCLLEIPVNRAIASLPPGLHPCIPGVIAVLHFHCAVSDIGPFDLLTTAVLCRSAAKHRMMTLSCFTNSSEAQSLFREGWGYPAVMATVKLAIQYDQVRSTVMQDGKALLDVATKDPIALTGPGASVRYAQSLNRAHTPHGSKLVQVDVSYDFKRSARGVPEFYVYDGVSLGDPHSVPKYPVSGTIVRANLVFDAARFIADPVLSAEAGGITVVREKENTTAVA